MSKQSPFFRPSLAKATLGSACDEDMYSYACVQETAGAVAASAQASLTEAVNYASKVAEQLPAEWTRGKEKGAPCPPGWAPPGGPDGDTCCPPGSKVNSAGNCEPSTGCSPVETLDANGACVPKEKRECTAYETLDEYGFCIPRKVDIDPTTGIVTVDDKSIGEASCGKNSALIADPKTFVVGCDCVKGYVWADGTSLDCKPAPAGGGGGGSSVARPTGTGTGTGTSKQSAVAPPAKPSSMNWPLIAGAVGIVAVGGAYLYSRSKKGSAGAKGKTKGKGKKR